jgi:hypothetical protein
MCRRLRRLSASSLRDGFVPYENEQRLAELEAMIERANGLPPRQMIATSISEP